MQVPLLPTSMNQKMGASNRFNYKNILSQIVEEVVNSSIIVKSLCAFILLGYLLSYAEHTFQVFCITPGKLLPPNFWLWTLITHSFLETRIFQALIDMIVILLYTKMLEPLWGTVECALFYFIVTISAGICTTFFYFALFALNFKEMFIFQTTIYGMGGLIGGYIVAIKQIMPDTLLFSFGIFRMKQDDLPLLLLIVSVILYLVNLINLSRVAMIFFGIIISWIYLRFYQKHKNGTKGDQSNSFSFASFFPIIMQPFIAIVSNTIFDLLVRIKICKRPPKRYNVGAPSHITISLPGGSTIDNSDAERRRQKALKALNERLKKPESEETKFDTQDLVSKNTAEVKSTSEEAGQPKNSLNNDNISQSNISINSNEPLVNKSESNSD